MSNVTSLLQGLGWPSLEQCHEITEDVVQKIMHNMVAIPLQNIYYRKRLYPQHFQQVTAHVNVAIYIAISTLSYIVTFNHKIWNVCQK